jgi:hypothetical protein
MKILIGLMLGLFISQAAIAAPRCLDLSKKQADTAVKLMKVAVYNGSPLIVRSLKEPGLVKPNGVWAEKKKGRKGKYRIRVDGREVDISLIYIAHSPQETRAWNVAWMSGCRPAANKPASISNNY